MEEIDISDWEVIENRVTTGSRTKYWVKNPLNGLFLFKEPKTDGEVYAEIAAALLGEKVYKLTVPETYIAVKEGNYGILTKSFVNRSLGERFEEIIDYFGADFDKNDLNHYLLSQAIEISKKYDILENFYEMCVFDSIIGNQDRHCENWGILYNSENKGSLAPLYDNGSSLLNGYAEEKIEMMLKDDKMIQGYINRAKTCFTVDNKKKAKVTNLILALKVYDSVLLKKTMKKFLLSDYNIIEDILNHLSEKYLSENRKKIIRILIERRTKIFFKIASEEG